MSIPTVAVTGASGHLGATLVRSLVNLGRRVRVLVHTQSGSLEGLSTHWVRGDVRDGAAVATLVSGADVVYHLAARISLHERDAEEMMSVNAEGTRTVAEASLRAGVRRFVHVSSIHALNPLPITETIDESRGPADERAGAPAYDRSKAAGERIVMELAARGLPALVMVPTAMIGPFDYQLSDMGRFFVKLMQRRMPGLVDADFDWVDVRDVVHAALLIETHGTVGQRYLVSGHRASLEELAGRVQAITGARPPRMVSPLWLARATLPFVSAYSWMTRTQPLYTHASLDTLAHFRKVSSAKITRELGYRARPLEQSVVETIDWLRGAFQLHG